MNSKIIAIIIVSVLLGFFGAQQINASKNASSLLRSDDFRVMTVESAELFKNLDKLEQENNTLISQQEKLKSTTKAQEEVIENDIRRFQIVADFVAVTGQGVEIDFEKPLLITEMTDLLNALRNIGAEAVAYNDRRITATSGFNLSDGQAPLKVKAIGEKQLLHGALTRFGGIIDVIGHGNVSQADNIFIAASLNL